MKYFLIALQFLTIIPLRKSIKIEEKDLSNSLIFFPVIGLIIGIFLILINYLISSFFSPLVVNTLIIIIWIGMSGALHLDGFCDTIDGLYGGQTKEERLKIMKDSSIGAKGAIALICLLILKLSLLMEISPQYKYQALLFTPMIGRWGMVMGIFLVPYAREEGMAKSFIKYKDTKQLFWASLITLTTGLFLFKFISLGIIGLDLGIIFISTLYLKRKIGGITGDTLGGLNEIIEVFTLLIIYCFIIR
ncbi:adenosylcobinamide-GDP ribazoletransferase [Candidatus Aerophobetes bacterium]|nr:adenosylcobinamide-GDP ribazoletransferase [Candidatus Aerophobetes bacterium]